MEVAGGPTLGYKGCGPGALVASAGAAASPAVAAYVGMRQFFDRVTAVTASMVSAAEGSGAGSLRSSSIEAEEESSLSLSSSSTADNSGEEEVQSDLKMGAFRSLESLEDCLPIKRGLSNCFAGKSKSFASLAEAGALASAGCLAKPENHFNKRQRILIVCKSSRQRPPTTLLPMSCLPAYWRKTKRNRKRKAKAKAPMRSPVSLSPGSKEILAVSQ